MAASSTIRPPCKVRVRGDALLALIFGLSIFLLVLTAGAARAQTLEMRIEGIIDASTAAYVERGLAKASAQNARLVVITMDTPGGLDSAMRSIVQQIVSSPLPVVVYVSPKGARAASAGVFILLAADYAAMAPATSLGAAHPVSGEGNLEGDLRDKATNDAAAYIRGLAERSGRNTAWAEQAVRESVSLTAQEALQQRVIEAQAEDVPILLNEAQGKHTQAKGLTLPPPGAVTPLPMSLLEQVTHYISHPNIAYLLLMLGFYGLLYEFSSPGLGFAGIGGAILLIIGFYALSALPLNWAAAALILLAFVLFGADLFAPSHGMLTGGGVIALVLGSFFLIDSPEVLRISPWIILVVTLLSLSFFGLILRSVWQSRRVALYRSHINLIGEEGVVKKSLDPSGAVWIHGELWQARSHGGPIVQGQSVRVNQMDNLTLTVEPLGKEGQRKENPAPEEKVT